MSQDIAKFSDQLPEVKQKTISMFFDVQKFEHAQRVAKVLSSSTLVPEHFRGQQNMGNVLIALNYAERIGADPFMCMQNMCVIHGKPGLEGKLVISLVNNCGRFDPIEFEEIGNLNKPEKESDGCIAYATDLKSGKVLKGPKIDWAMVKAEKWLDKNGSKWKTMAPLMFRYRAATYFARVYCPEVLLGMQTREELVDVTDAVQLRKSDSGAYEGELISLSERLKDGISDEAIEVDEEEKSDKKTEKEKPADAIDQPSEQSIYAQFDAIQQKDTDGIQMAMEACGFTNEPSAECDLKKIVDKYNENARRCR